MAWYGTIVRYGTHFESEFFCKVLIPGWPQALKQADDENHVFKEANRETFSSNPAPCNIFWKKIR